ncbi:MAG: hypothetical protein FJ090_14760 [Deltaproteobacteria bacterium]|nr:hypothetical protein [Deltaproteobacteria bacterium]
MYSDSQKRGLKPAWTRADGARGTTRLLNLRVTEEELAAIKAVALPGESMSDTLRRALRSLGC